MLKRASILFIPLKFFSIAYSRIGLWGAIKPGFRSPVVIARMFDAIGKTGHRDLFTSSASSECPWNSLRCASDASRVPHQGMGSTNAMPEVAISGHLGRPTRMVATLGHCPFLNGMSDVALRDQIEKHSNRASRTAFKQQSEEKYLPWQLRRRHICLGSSSMV